MQVIIWGARGSTAVSTEGTSFYGGDTSCIEIITKAGDHIILDAGTGIRELSDRRVAEAIKEYSICFTHAHWDHLQGIPFFKPLYNKDSRVNFYGPENIVDGGVEVAIESILNGKNFPLCLESTLSQKSYTNFTPGESFKIGTATIETCSTVHPGGCVAYKISSDGWTMVFSGDHEWERAEENAEARNKFKDFIKGADLLIADAHFFPDEIAKHQGWGHSAVDDWPLRAHEAGVKKLILTHHAPERTDIALQIMKENLDKRYGHLDIKIAFAFEGMILSSPEKKDSSLFQKDVPLSCWLCDFSHEISSYTDVSMILDSILREARSISGADAGTIYIVEENDLIFAYTQNATLFTEEESMRQLYQDARIPISSKSMAGYVALTKETLVIDDVRKIAQDKPYSFNENLDISSGYRTVSMMVMPLILRKKVVGVLQLINNMDRNGKPIPFSIDSEARLLYLSNIAVTSFERGMMANELILRMLSMISMRDPSETSGHVKRVGAIAAEIYHQWALNRNTDLQELRRMKDHIRLAAMLHDVGKIGIPDAILKKPGPLNEEERRVMERHCYYGKILFTNVDWGVDEMARDIALHHHQRWDGKGYTGHPDEAILKGEDIPWAARITSVADVYDALVSKRAYKDAFETDFSVSILKEGAGTQFDPEIVEAFLEILPIVNAIRKKYPEENALDLEASLKLA